MHQNQWMDLNSILALYQLGCWPQDWHSQGKSVTMKDKKCRNERKTTTAQDDFFGNRPHAGWSWLATQAKAWPTPYRAHFWEGFSGEDDSFKGTSDINEGTQ